MMVNIAVCDDKQESLDIIQKELVKAANNLNITIETYLYMDGNEVVDLICNNKEEFDILFLDIDMPNISGLAHEQYVFESIDYNPFKYIRKNKIEEEIEYSLKRAYKRISSENAKSIVVKTEDGEVRLKHTSIMYFEVYARRMSVFTNDNQKRNLVGRKTMKKLYSELNDEDFIQIHSGCIVNVKYIDEYSGHDITLDNGIKLIVSRPRIKEVKEAISSYWSRRV